MPADATSKFGAWIEQPQAYLRTMGSDIPYHDPFPHRSSVKKKTGTWEVLLHRVKGRFLTIRLTLTGTGRNTPHIRSLRVYYPRFSYLNQYLPAVYRDDETSADFLERFLANVEGLYTTIEDRIAWAQVLFDVDSVPSEFLDWLAGWFEIIQQESWGEGRRRLWLAHAMELFSQRGTVPGIIRAVRLATDPCPEESIFTEDVTAYYHPESTPQGIAFSGFHVRIVENFLF
jgi:phage tail-like protein